MSCSRRSLGLKKKRNMQFMIKAHDGDNMLEKRMEVRPRHLENMAKVNGKVICAGGLLDDGGKVNYPPLRR